ILRQAAFEKTPRLVAELADALGYEGGVDFVIAVHGGTLIDVAAASRPEPVIMTCGEVIWQWRPLQAGPQPVVCRPWAMPLTLASKALEKILVLAPRGAPAAQQIHLHQVHGVDIGVSQPHG